MTKPTDPQIKMKKNVKGFLLRNAEGLEIAGLFIRRVIGEGITAITFEAEDSFGKRWALKLVTRESYGAGAPFKEKARFSKVKDDRFLALPEDIGEENIQIDEDFHSLVWIKSRIVRGQTLREFLNDNTEFIPRSEILTYLENMTVALLEMEAAGFYHGDLHAGNIMREVIGDEGLIPEVRYVIIDFSEAYSIDDPQSGLKNDLENFGEHLRAFYDNISKRDIPTRDDEKVLKAISHIPGLVTGSAPETIGICNPNDLLNRYKIGLKAIESAPRKLREPFTIFSTEYIANEALLADLCYTKMNWVRNLRENSNVLLIGPRGCGKTMHFKRMRLKTKIRAEKYTEIRNDEFLSFYIPCESLFFMRFSDLTNADIDAYTNELIMFFNMAILAEITSALSQFPNEVGVIPRGIVFALNSFIQEELGELWETLNFPKNIATLQDFKFRAEAVMRFLRKKIAFGDTTPIRVSRSFITDLVILLKSEAPFLNSRHFIFLLDDYTSERVPIPLQNHLHPIVCQRSKDLCFKISAHMFGSIYSYPRPLALDEGRNITVINLGTIYLKRDPKSETSQHLIKILDERLNQSEDYKGTISDWLGHTTYPGRRTLARSLHNKSTRKQAYYHGLQCIIDLCTGDYSEMIRMVDEIFREAKIGPGTEVFKIPPNTQHRAIVNISREFLGRIRQIRPDGPKLFSVVENFGKLSKTLLYEKELVGQGNDSRGNPRRDPYDLLTIYVDDLLDATKAARYVWERLQQASIFIDIGLAPSQRSVVSDRVTLRRIYCPAFRTTLTSSEHLQATKGQFEYFMDQPKEFCRNLAQKRLKKDDSPTFWDNNEEFEFDKDVELLSNGASHYPDEEEFIKFEEKTSDSWVERITSLPKLASLSDSVGSQKSFDLFVGAFGFEERTTEGVKSCVELGVTSQNAIMFEYDMFHKETEERRGLHEDYIVKLLNGKSYRTINATVSYRDPFWSDRFRQRIDSLQLPSLPRVLFDCSSCASLIHSSTLSVLLNLPCELYIIYSEAETYYPLRQEYENGMISPSGERVRGPFTGFSFAATPPLLQADDSGEMPVMLILFPTSNTERTDGVLAEIDPAARIWVFGKPHDPADTNFRLSVAKSFAAPLMHEKDPWTIIDTFDYKATLESMAGIYATYRSMYRIVVMPHGTKMQTLGVSIFQSIHQLSSVFALPKTYNATRYSIGCRGVHYLELGNTIDLIKYLRDVRVIGDK